MPIYLYHNDTSGETKEVFQRMNDVHEYEEDGIKWRRLFTCPMASIDTKIDPDSPKQFLDKTGNKKGTMGDLMDLSAELSSKRERGGEDPVKRKFFDDYKTKNKGQRHLQDTPKKIDTKVATIEF